MKPKDFELLTDAIKSLPSIGTKAAEKIAYHLIKQNNEYINEFVSRIINAKTNIKFCKQCGNFAINDLCEICKNDKRDNKKLCIVNNIDELYKIESTNIFNGIYFILNDEINIKNKKMIDDNTIKKLIAYCNNKKFESILIATNFTINGEATNIYLNNLVKKILPNSNRYKLAIGLPTNSLLNYADVDTLKYAIKNKTKLL